MKRVKAGGRTAGTPNKITATTKELITKVLDNNIERLQDDLDSMTPVDRVKCLIALARLIVPTQVEANVNNHVVEMPQPIILLNK